VIYYPHFSTSQIHSNIVDWLVNSITKQYLNPYLNTFHSVTFHGDLVLSKALHEDCIVLWLIKGFNSTSAPPPQSSAPTNYDTEPDTRSAFSPPPSAFDRSRQYTRLLQFAIPDCFEFYMRFSLYSPLSAPVTHPILAMCNSASKVYFWDFKRLEEFHDYVMSSKDIHGDASQSVQRPVWLPASRSKGKSRDADTESTTASSHTLSTEAAMANPADIPPSQTRKYAMGDPFGMVEAHKVVDTKLKGSWTGRQVAWSACGKWCVVVGSPNVIAVFERWADRKEKGRRED
jgi:polycomb protein EED